MRTGPRAVMPGGLVRVLLGEHAAVDGENYVITDASFLDRVQIQHHAVSGAPCRAMGRILSDGPWLQLRLVALARETASAPALLTKGVAPQLQPSVSSIDTGHVGDITSATS
jgi:hypothetical protein